MQYQHPQFDESVNVTPGRPLIDFGTYLLAIIVLMAAIFYGSLYAVELVIPHIDPQTEQRIWNAILRDRFVSDSGKADKALAQQESYLQSLLDRIPKDGLTGAHYQVILVKDSEANALALPSGKIIVYTGLLEKLKTENGIVFVLGHELGHFANRDHLRGMGRILIAGLLAAPLMTDVSSPLLNSIGAGLDMHFSRKQESAADEYGLHALIALYGHAGGATEFFDTIQKAEKDSLIWQYASTHPVTGERLAHLNEIIEKEKIVTLPTIPKKP